MAEIGNHSIDIERRASFVGLDSTPIIANTKQNSPKAFIRNKFSKEACPKRDPDCALGAHPSSPSAVSALASTGVEIMGRGTGIALNIGSLPRTKPQLSLLQEDTRFADRVREMQLPL